MQHRPSLRVRRSEDSAPPAVVVRPPYPAGDEATEELKQVLKLLLLVKMTLLKRYEEDRRSKRGGAPPRCESLRELRLRKDVTRSRDSSREAEEVEAEESEVDSIPLPPPRLYKLNQDDDAAPTPAVEDLKGAQGPEGAEKRSCSPRKPCLDSLA